MGIYIAQGNRMDRLWSPIAQSLWPAVTIAIGNTPRAETQTGLTRKERASMMAEFTKEYTCPLWNYLSLATEIKKQKN